MSQREYGDEDVKAFIERASSIAHRSADALSADDLKKIGTDLGFSDAVVAGALQALERDRVRAVDDDARRAALKTRNMKLVAAFVAFDVVTLGGLYGHGASLKSEAEVHRAAIVSALDRQREVEKRFTTGTREGDAEVAGSLNRVTIARKRYDEAAIAYNESIGRGVHARTLATLERSDLERSDLERSDLERSDLERRDLEQSDLERSDHAVIANALAFTIFIALAAPPAIDKPVVDAANVLDSYDESDLADELKGVRANGGPQMAVLIVTSTDGTPIEDYANDAATAWGGGSTEANDGLLLVIATQDRKVRLEVGEGLEARLPDSEAARLVDMAATSFRGSRWREGAGIIVNGVTWHLERERMGVGPPKEDQTVQGMLFIAGAVTALIILFMFVRARLTRRRGAALPYAGAPRAGDESLPFEARLPPEGAGNAFAGQMARDREAFQKDPESSAPSTPREPRSTRPSSSSSSPSRSSSSSSSSPSSSSSSNTGGTGGGGKFGGGGASGSF